MSEDPEAIECSGCGETPELHEAPYRSDSAYIVTCGCDAYEIDVSECVNPSSLVEPPTGKWANFDK